MKSRSVEDVKRCWRKKCQGTLARARRENDEKEVHCRNVLEHIHHALMINIDEECMLARVKGNSRNRKLDDLLFEHDNSWSAFWSRPQADDEMPIEPCEAFRCLEAVGHVRFQLTRCAAKRSSLPSARGRFEVVIRTETLDVSSGQKLEMDTALKVACRGVGH